MRLLQLEATALSLEVPHLLERSACRESAGSFNRKRGALEVSLARRRGIERGCRAGSSSHQAPATTRRFAWPGPAPTSGFSLKLPFRSVRRPTSAQARRQLSPPNFPTLSLSLSLSIYLSIHLYLCLLFAWKPESPAWPIRIMRERDRGGSGRKRKTR